MQPTLFSTDDPAGGVALHDGGVLAGGGGQGGEGDRGGGSGRDGNGGGEGQVTTGDEGGRLLNAWEKIEELEGLVESSRSHNERYRICRRPSCRHLQIQMQGEYNDVFQIDSSKLGPSGKERWGVGPRSPTVIWQSNSYDGAIEMFVAQQSGHFACVLYCRCVYAGEGKI